jgi:hypothetical protein
MPHVIESAVSGRSRCRGCGGTITRGALRFGECLANPYSDGDTMIWYHPICAAYRRPEPFLTALSGSDIAGERERLDATARFSAAHRRVCRMGALERAASGRARCRCCRQLIPRDGLRIPLLFYEEGVFTASGFVHLECASAYFETSELLECLQHFTPRIDAVSLREAAAVLG